MESKLKQEMESKWEKNISLFYVENVSWMLVHIDAKQCFILTYWWSQLLTEKLIFLAWKNITDFDFKITPEDTAQKEK